MLEPIKKQVDAVREQGIKVICLEKYNSLLYVVTGNAEGSFVSKQFDSWDVVLDYYQISKIAAHLQMSVEPVLEAALLHECGHALCSSINKEYFDSEKGAWFAGEILRQNIGSISALTYQKFCVFCVS